MRRVLAGLAAAGLQVTMVPAGGGASAVADRERWHTRVFASVPAPGYPAYAFTHRNGRVYAGTYANPSTRRRSPTTRRGARLERSLSPTTPRR